MNMHYHKQRLKVRYHMMNTCKSPTLVENNFKMLPHNQYDSNILLQWHRSKENIPSFSSLSDIGVKGQYYSSVLSEY